MSRYNASALVNRGNVHFVEDEFDAAQEMYLEAIGVEADCTEAVFNLALVYKQRTRPAIGPCTLSDVNEQWGSWRMRWAPSASCTTCARRTRRSSATLPISTTW